MATRDQGHFGKLEDATDKEFEHALLKVLCGTLAVLGAAVGTLLDSWWFVTGLALWLPWDAYQAWRRF